LGGCSLRGIGGFTPNPFQLDRAVVYFERLPDTVTDHVDRGFRLSAIYGENYRHTTAFGLASYQQLGRNLYNGYDFPDGLWRTLRTKGTRQNDGLQEAHAHADSRI